MIVNFWISWMSILDIKNENTLKNAKNNKLRNTKYQNSTKGSPVFIFTMPGGRLAPLPPSVTPLPVVLIRMTSSQTFRKGPQFKKSSGPENQNSPLVVLLVFIA